MIADKPVNSLTVLNPKTFSILDIGCTFFFAPLCLRFDARMRIIYAIVISAIFHNAQDVAFEAMIKHFYWEIQQNFHRFILPISISNGVSRMGQTIAHFVPGALADSVSTFCKLEISESGIMLEMRVDITNTRTNIYSLAEYLS